MHRLSTMAIYNWPPNNSRLYDDFLALTYMFIAHAMEGKRW